MTWVFGGAEPFCEDKPAAHQSVGHLEDAACPCSEGAAPNPLHSEITCAHICLKDSRRVDYIREIGKGQSCPRWVETELVQSCAGMFWDSDGDNGGFSDVSANPDCSG